MVTEEEYKEMEKIIESVPLQNDGDAVVIKPVITPNGPMYSIKMEKTIEFGPVTQRIQKEVLVNKN